MKRLESYPAWVRAKHNFDRVTAHFGGAERRIADIESERATIGSASTAMARAQALARGDEMPVSTLSQDLAQAYQDRDDASRALPLVRTEFESATTVASAETCREMLPEYRAILREQLAALKSAAAVQKREADFRGQLEAAGISATALIPCPFRVWLGSVADENTPIGLYAKEVKRDHGLAV